MNAHFSTKTVDKNGDWLDLVNIKNSSSDMAPTAGQVPRALGLAMASKLFRNSPVYNKHTHLSDNGNEICFCTIGDASTSEGHFWEGVNAAGVSQIPLAVFIWDDGYGISVPKELQTTKGSISTAIRRIEKMEGTNGVDIYNLKGWDYAGMCEVLDPAIQKIRDTHTPAIFHIEEITQPQGHSTSGSHERYKSAERLAWEKEWDCNLQMRNWILENSLAEEHELIEIETNAKLMVKESKQKAWEKYLSPLKQQVQAGSKLMKELAKNLPSENGSVIVKMAEELEASKEPLRRDLMKCLATCLDIAGKNIAANGVRNYYNDLAAKNTSLYNTFLYNEGPKSALKVKEIKPEFTEDAKMVNGFEVLNKYFDQLFESNDKVTAFGEDVGLIGDVNQGFSGLQEKHGKERIFDTGIRELSIMGQGIGLALRGLRPIAEIQYLDYMLYGLQTLSDDCATTHYRTAGGQSCPIIVRTRGHRLEGIWHSGSPMGMIINSLRGMYVCVPRNMVQAVGMYNTLLQSNDPGLMIECLNGYRLKEKLPTNLLTYTVPLGIPEIVKAGRDITLVSYGATLRIVMEAAETLQKMQISCEVIDVQTLLPFDVNHQIVESLKKTNRIIFVDEDVPGGAAAFMFNKVMEEQAGYKYLDISPRTITAKAHRPSYSSDGDYFSKPNTEDVVRVVKEMMAE
jgi:pyruvate/2-oxoglutarate/acetoin dehydrogenase E1 component/TPP-dependent pyruvate/acetoin dehydrogenase alpha subunit